MLLSRRGGRIWGFTGGTQYMLWPQVWTSLLLFAFSSSSLKWYMSHSWAIYKYDTAGVALANFSNSLSAMQYFSVGVWLFWEMRPMGLSLCHSLPPTSTFCTYWGTFSPTPSHVGSSARLHHRHKAMKTLSLASRWPLCCGLGCSFHLQKLMFVEWTGFKMQSGWASKRLLFLFVVSIEEAQFTSNQLCGVGAGCR